MPTDRCWISCWAVVFTLLAAACDEPEPPPFAPQRDGAVARLDGSLVMRIDAGQDAGETEVLDAEVLDAEVLDDGGDATVARPPDVDGVIAAGEWDGALEAHNETPAFGATPEDRLTRLLVLRTEDRLYVAIEGTVGENRGMLLLLDADYRGASGAVLNGSALVDSVGTLDSAISASLFSSVDPDLRPDYAWGALGIPLAVDGSSERAGWRDIATFADDFVALATGHRTACSVSACETSIALGSAGIAGAGEIAIAVRSGSEVGFLSNQTLPMDLPGSPEQISVVLRVPVPATTGP